MTEAASNALQMPAKPILVAEAVARLDTAGLRSQLVALDTNTLEGLGLRLANREWSVSECINWLNAERKERGEDAIDKNAVYRFGEHFRRIYGQVRAEHARRIARLTVEGSTDAKVKAMGQVAQGRLTELVAEKLVEANTLDDLTGGEVGAAISMLTGLAKGEFNREKLRLQAVEAEGKARKLEADLAKSELERQKLAQDLAKRSAEFDAQKAKAAKEAAAVASAGGGADAVVSKVREVLGIAA